VEGYLGPFRDFVVFDVASGQETKSWFAEQKLLLSVVESPSHLIRVSIVLAPKRGEESGEFRFST